MITFVPLLYIPAVVLIALTRWSKHDSVTPLWRGRVITLGMVSAIVVLVADLSFSLSWWHNGGSPHGFEPSPGLWTVLRPSLKWVYGSALLLAAFGRGKQRVYLCLSVVSVFLAGTLVHILQME